MFLELLSAPREKRPGRRFHERGRQRYSANAGSPTGWPSIVETS
jgi:hypothetical protein